MSDSTALLPASVMRNLSDKLYEKRKNAALEVEGIVKSLTTVASGSKPDHDRIAGVINILINDFALSAQANHRKGGLIGLAAATVGLAQEAGHHLDKIVPPVLNSFTDQDSRVRYYACEALYNIAKVSRGDFIVFFNDIFNALCKLSADSDPNVQSAAHLLDRLVKDIVTESDQFRYSELQKDPLLPPSRRTKLALFHTFNELRTYIEEFIPLLREKMNVLNPYVRQFLVGWITVLDSVPDIDMLGFLPDFLDGLFNMLSDPSHEIRQQADAALSEFLLEIKNAPSVDYGRMAEILVQRAGAPDEFTRLTSITWVNEFVKLGREQLVPHYSAILGAILPCISDKEEKIRVVARETNEELRLTKADPAEGFAIEAMLDVARRGLRSEWEATRLEALRWIQTLLETHRTEVLSFLDQIFPALLQSLSDVSDEVVLLVLDVQAYIARDAQHFRYLMVFLVKQFRESPSLLEKRGALAVRRLCTLLDSEKVYRELATILEGEADLEFASIMVQALNLILLTASELADLRALLKQSLSTSTGRDLFVALYSSWCHSPMATVSLCLLAQAYLHASSVIQSLGEADINVNLLVQVDKLVRLLETPIFAYLRLQLLEAGRQPALLKTLYGLLMLLPQQSSAFKILRTRLKTVPAQTFMNVQPSLAPSSTPEFSGLSAMRRTASGGPYAQILSHIPAIPTVSSQTANDDSVPSSEPSNGTGGINFVTQLQQFEHMQQQHRIHRVAQEQTKRQSRKPPLVPVQQNGLSTMKTDEVVEQRRGRGASDENSRASPNSRMWRGA